MTNPDISSILRTEAPGSVCSCVACNTATWIFGVSVLARKEGEKNPFLIQHVNNKIKQNKIKPLLIFLQKVITNPMTVRTETKV